MQSNDTSFSNNLQNGNENDYGDDYDGDYENEDNYGSDYDGYYVDDNVSESNELDGGNNRNPQNRNPQNRNPQNRNPQNRNPQNRNPQNRNPHQYSIENIKEKVNKWNQRQIQQYTEEQIQELIQNANYIIVSGESNDILDKLCNIYVTGYDLPDNIIDKLKEYDPFLFQTDVQCNDKECTTSQIYPRLLQYSFRSKQTLQQLTKIPYKIILFNILANIKGIGRYFQENINIPESAPIPDVDQEMFVECQAQQWITKTINQNQKQNKIALYYDDQHILLCEDVLTEQQIQQLTQMDVVFDGDVLQYNRYLNTTQIKLIQLNILKHSDSYGFDNLFSLYNIPEDMRQSLQNRTKKQQSMVVITSVGEALRFQDMIQKEKEQREKERKEKEQQDKEQQKTKNEGY